MQWARMILQEQKTELILSLGGATDVTNLFNIELQMCSEQNDVEEYQKLLNRFIRFKDIGRQT